MEKFLTTWLPLLIVGIPLLTTTITFLCSAIGSKKALKFAENTNKIGNSILQFIEIAEKFVNYSDKEKKENAMTRAMKFAIDNKIKFDEEEVSKKVEELVTFSKKINQREKDKESEV